MAVRAMGSMDVRMRPRPTYTMAKTMPATAIGQPMATISRSRFKFGGVKGILTLKFFTSMRKNRIAPMQYDTLVPTAAPRTPSWGKGPTP